MGNWRGKLLGQTALELFGADPAAALNRLTAGRIPFWNIVWKDQFTVSVVVPSKAVGQARAAAEKAMCEVREGRQSGALLWLRRLLRRPVLVLCLLFNLAAALLLPQFVFFYEVEGNETVPEAQILRAMEELGVGFGTFGPDIRPQWIKDHMLNLIPELQWITVTQNGCLAQVVVRERLELPETEDRKAPAHVVATQSGIITSQSILAGQALFEVGDTVVAGDRLVSGLVDLERTYILEHANAEIYARTWRKGTVYTPDSCLRKTYTGQVFHSVWLEIGRQRIKIFGNSGILSANCDKMIERTPWTLPGGYCLPVTLVVETCRPYTLEEVPLSAVDGQMCLEAWAEETVSQAMVAGKILERDFSLTRSQGCYRLDWSLECEEMIARQVEFEFTKEDFTYDGTNSQRGTDGAGD